MSHTGLEHALHYDLQTPPDTCTRKTRVVCTVGPKTSSVSTLCTFLHSGMTVMRLNMSHGDHAYHSMCIANLRKAIQTTGINCAIAIDIRGPKVRTGRIAPVEGSSEPPKISVLAGDVVTFTTDAQYATNCSKEHLYVDYERLLDSVSTEYPLFIDDGVLRLNVTKIDTEKREVVCKAVNTHSFGDRKGVNFPCQVVYLPAVTEKDKADIELAVKEDVDFIFASFARRGEHIREMHDLIKKFSEGKSRVKIVAKIESQEGIDNIDSILKQSDGLMVARGDLGVEIPLEKVFLVQKVLIAKCNCAAKPVICATQMLESMTQNPRPTRAEASDVANAVLDGADAVMLSAETASGNYPVECVVTMANICCEAEYYMAFVFPLQSFLDYSSYWRAIRHVTRRPLSVAEATAASAVSAASDQHAALVLVITEGSGKTCRLVAKYRPRVRVLALTANERVARQVLLSRGVSSLLLSKDEFRRTNDILKRGIEHAKAEEYCKSGDYVIAIYDGDVQDGIEEATMFRVLQVP